MPAKTLGAERNGYQRFLGLVSHLVRSRRGISQGRLRGDNQLTPLRDRDWNSVAVAEPHEIAA